MHGVFRSAGVRRLSWGRPARTAESEKAQGGSLRHSQADAGATQPLAR